MTENSPISFLVAFLSVFFLTLILTRLCRELALKLDIVAYPGERKIHKEPIPYLGGVAVLLGFFLPLLIFFYSDQLFLFFLASLMVGGIGLADDLVPVNAALKLIVLSVAVFLSSRNGLSSNLFPSVSGGEFFDTLLTLFWVVLLISAFNASDNMDGLAAGYAFIACLMFFIIGGIQFPQPRWSLYSTGMSGALVAFLLFNFHPSVIFLGDCGSFFLGFFVAILAVMGEWSSSSIKAVIIPVIILSVPILDLAATIFYRYVTGVTESIVDSITYSAKDHLSHRIQQVRNFGQRRTVLILYNLALVVGLLGVIMRNTHPLEASLALGIVAILYLMVLFIILPGARQLLGLNFRRK